MDFKAIKALQEKLFIIKMHPDALEKKKKKKNRKILQRARIE